MLVASVMTRSVVTTEPTCSVASASRLMHDGRGKSIEDVLKKHHNPDALAGQGELTAEELADLVAYLKSL